MRWTRFPYSLIPLRFRSLKSLNQEQRHRLVLLNSRIGRNVGFRNLLDATFWAYEVPKKIAAAQEQKKWKGKQAHHAKRVLKISLELQRRFRKLKI